MEDTIEICSGCGKMPRPIDAMSGGFVCSRCGNNLKLSVKADDYEKIASDLDQRFHSRIQKVRIEAAADHPVEMKRPAKAAKAAKKPPKAAPKAAKAPKARKTARPASRKR